MQHLPEDYALVEQFELAQIFQPKKISRRLLGVIIFSGFIGGLAFGIILSQVRLVRTVLDSSYVMTPNLPIFLLVIIFVLVLHEAIHGVAFWRYRGRPKFGAKMIGGRWNIFGLVFYAQAEGYYPRNQYVVIGLSPLVVITLIGTFGLAIESIRSYAFWAMFLNGFGAVGDMIMIARLRKHPPSVLVRDTADGYEVYASEKNIIG